MDELANAIKEFIQHCKYEKNLSSKTIKAYQIDLKQLLDFLLKRNYSTEIDKITKIELREYLTSISELKPKSIKRKIVVIKSLFDYLEFDDKILFNPVRKMNIKIKEPKRLPHFLNTKEMTEIFKTVYKETNVENKNNSYLVAIRNTAVIELLFATGVRVSEIANLEDADLDLHSGSMTIKGKGDKERIVNIRNKDTLELLKTYRQLFIDKIRLAGSYFLVNRLNQKLSDQSIRSIVKDLSIKASIGKHVTPHMFRHSFATLLLERGVDVKVIQSLLGHSSIITTQIYTHVSQQKQRGILEDKHPRKEFSIG